MVIVMGKMAYTFITELGKTMKSAYEREKNGKKTADKSDGDINMIPEMTHVCHSCVKPMHCHSAHF